MKQLFKFIFFCLVVFSVIKSEVYAYSMPADTIRQKKVNGIKVKPYKVQSKETWTSISQKCKVSVAYLKAVNAGVENLKTGQIINLPIEEGTVRKDNVVSFTESVEPSEVKGTGKKQNTADSTKVIEPDSTPPAAPLNEEEKESKYKKPIEHSIKKGDTVFRLAKLYNQTPEKIRLWNNLKNNDLKIGQKIIVNYVYQYRKEQSKPTSKVSETKLPTEESKITEKVKSVPAPVENIRDRERSSKAVTTLHSPEKLLASADKNVILTEESKSTPSEVSTNTFKAANGHTIKEINETGVASWIMDGEQNKSKYYALHRNAPLGTIVKVTNRMNGKYVFVKVVGLLPDTGDNDNLIIKISQAASNKINVLDSKFQAELSYGVAQ